MLEKQVCSNLSTFYCLCSAMSYADLLDKQKNKPLEFKKFIDQYTNCNQGCGSCIDNLYNYLSENRLLIE
jgi:hypothetical protein